MSSADRVRKLAALAGSENEHEANAAARQACRLIREGKVRIEDIREAPAERPRPQARPRAAWSPWEEPPRPPPPPRRPAPRGPFARSRSTEGQACAACGERIEVGDAFSCVGGFVHGDCVPKGERA